MIIIIITIQRVIGDKIINGTKGFGNIPLLSGNSTDFVIKTKSLSYNITPLQRREIRMG